MPKEVRRNVSPTTHKAVGQQDSLTDQPRKNVSDQEQMAPASYQPRDPSCLESDTDLDDSMTGDDMGFYLPEVPRR